MFMGLVIADGGFAEEGALIINGNEICARGGGVLIVPSAVTEGSEWSTRVENDRSYVDGCTRLENGSCATGDLRNGQVLRSARGDELQDGTRDLDNISDGGGGASRKGWAEDKQTFRSEWVVIFIDVLYPDGRIIKRIDGGDDANSSNVLTLQGRDGGRALNFGDEFEVKDWKRGVKRSNATFTTKTFFARRALATTAATLGGCES